MASKIGLISDVHASPAFLAAALDVFRRHRVDEIICAGDIAGYYDGLAETIHLLQQADCRCIIGNHDQAYLSSHCEAQATPECRFLQALPPSLQFSAHDQRIFCVHAEPPDIQHGGIKLLDIQGQIIPQQQAAWNRKLEDFAADILVVGHTHQVFAERLADVLVINPGSTVFNHSCMILHPADRRVETFALNDREIVPCWNFSMLYGSGHALPTPGQ